MKAQALTLHSKNRGVASGRKRVAPRVMASTLAIVLLGASPSALRAQSVLFAGAQTTLPTNRFNSPPYGVAVDRAGDVFIVDSLSSSVVELPWTGSGYGAQTTVPASGLKQALGVAVDAAGDIFMADTYNNRVVEVPWTGSGYGAQITVPTSGLNDPYGVGVDAAGDVFIADTLNNRVVELPWTGSGYGAQTTVTSSVDFPAGVALDAAGDLFIASNYGVVEMPWTGSGFGAQTTVPTTEGIDAFDVAVDGAGNLFIADQVNNRVVELPWTGSGFGAQITVATSGLNSPKGVAVDGAGDVFIGDYGNDRVVEVQTQSVNFGSINVCPAGQTSSCSQTTMLTYNITTGGTLGAPSALTQGAPNLDFTLASGSTCSGEVTAGSTCTVNVTFAPTGPGARSGAVELSDGSGNVLATTLVYGQGQGPAIAYGPGTQASIGGLSVPYAVTMDGTGNLFILDRGTGSIVKVPAGGGAPTTLATGIPQAALNAAGSLAVDGAGNLFFISFNSRAFYEVTLAGVTSSVSVSGLSNPRGIAVDGAGNVYISDQIANVVVEVSPTGSQTTLATGLSSPAGLAVDQAGDVFIADALNKRVVEVPAGGGSLIPIATGLSNPQAVAVDGAGDVYIADSGNNRVIEVPAGGGSLIPIATGLLVPEGVAVDGAGNVSIADSANHRVVEVQRSTPPALNFASTPVGQTSSDSPQSFTIQNIGNQPLISAVAPGLSIGANFEQVTGSGTPEDCFSGFSLVPGASCNLSISFEPITASAINSSAVLTDNALNGNPATQTISLSGTGTPGSQTIDFPSLPDVTYGADPISLTATASTGLPVSFASETQQVCSVTGTTVTVLRVGTCTVEAIQTGNANYQEAKVQNSFTVNPVTPTLSFAAIANQTYGAAPFTVSATSNSTGAITYSVVSGPATISGSTVTITGVGMVTLQASIAAAGNYTTTTATTSFTVNAATPTLSFAFIPRPVYGAAPFAVSATSNSSGAITYSVVSGPATISGNTVTITGAGTVTLQASVAAAGGYTATTAQNSFAVLIATLNVNTNSASRAYGAANPTLTYTITGFVNGDTSSVVSGTATLTTTATTTSAPGKYPISFSTEELTAANYGFVYVIGIGTLTVTQASQTITFGALPNVTYGAAPITLTATSSSSLPVTYTVAGPATVSGSTLTITGAGTVTVTASQAGNTDYTEATPVVQSFTVSPVTPTLSFAAIPNQAYGAAPFAVSATSNSTGTITYSVVSGPATVSGNIVTLTGVGSVMLQASVAAAGNYAATTATTSFAVSAATPTLSFAAIPNQAYGAAPFAVSATSNSTGAITYSVVSGPATVSGGTVTLTGAGTVTLQASIAAAGNYTTTTATTSFTVNPAPQTITFSLILPQPLGTQLTLSASASSGLPVTFTSQTTGICTVSGTIVTLTNAGTCIIQASQAGNANYAAATPALAGFTVNAATPTLSFAAIPNQAYGAAPFAVSATSSSTGTITYSVVSGPATISGNTVTLTGVGTVTLQASVAAAGNYAATTATTSFAVSAATPTLSFAGIPNQTYGAAPFAVSATSNSTGTITYSVVSGPATVSGNTVTLTGVGTVTLQASVAAAGNYAATTATASFAVSAATPTLTFAAIPNQVYGAAPFAVSATSNSTGAITYSVVGGPATISGNTVTLTGVGTVTLKASLAASGNYTAATATTSFAVNPASQTITFNPISSQPQGTQLTLSASASSGLAVTFTSQTTGICTVSGTTVTLTTAGTCTIKASQAGNANYAAATPVSQSFTVSAAAANFTITPIPGNETIKRGVLAAYILQLNAGKGFSGNVTLSCSGGPAGANCADFPMTLKLKSNEVAFAVSGILFPKNTTPGTYTITFTGVSGSTTESATATFTVTK